MSLVIAAMTGRYCEDLATKFKSFESIPDRAIKSAVTCETDITLAEILETALTLLIDPATLPISVPSAATVVTLLAIPATVLTSELTPATEVTLEAIPATVVTLLDIPATVLMFAWLLAETVTVCHADPVQTFVAFAVVSKNKAPVTRASPSLSTDGSEDLAPKYLSSKSSKLLAAEVAELALAVALFALAVAEFALAVAEFAEAVALEAAFVALVVALAASTSKDHLAESVLVVSGCDPELV